MWYVAVWCGMKMGYGMVQFVVKLWYEGMGGDGTVCGVMGCVTALRWSLAFCFFIPLFRFVCLLRGVWPAYAHARGVKACDTRILGISLWCYDIE